MQGTAGVEVPVPGADVVVPQQYLGSGDVIALEGALVALYQYRLAHRRSRLQVVHQVRAVVPAQAHETRGHRAAGHQHHLATLLAQQHQLGHQAGDHILVQPAAVVGQQGAADLYHPAP